MSNLAVIYTGQLRTIFSTLANTKKMFENQEADFFCVLQCDSESQKETYEREIRKALSNRIKYFMWFNKQDSDYINIRENCLSNMKTEEKWKNYLRNSGSIIEYYQLHLAHEEICKYEKQMREGKSYEYIMRLRCDLIIKDEICFNTSYFTKDYIKICMKQIMDQRGCKEINQDIIEKVINDYMIPNRSKYNITDIFNRIPSEFSKRINSNLSEEEIIEKIHEYIHSQPHLISFRKNVLYFGKRDLFHVLQRLGTNYGEYKFEEEPIYWFNAESQLIKICTENKIDYYSSCSVLEGNSLYKYNKNNYYANNEQLKEDEEFSWFVKRK